MLKEKAIATITDLYGNNAVYVLNDYAVKNELDYLEKYETDGKIDLADFCYEQALKKAEFFHKNKLSPETVNVGDGVTVHYYTDAHAGTIIKKTKYSITIRRDKATLDPAFKPDFIIGGFCAHCTNQDEQKYTYEPDLDGVTQTFRWSKKLNCYQYCGLQATKGRHKFHDYNF